MTRRTKNDEERRLKRNTTDRRRYAELSQEKKEALLLKRRQRYTEKKKLDISTKINPPGVGSHEMPLLSHQKHVSKQYVGLTQTKDAKTTQTTKEQAPSQNMNKPTQTSRQTTHLFDQDEFTVNATLMQDSGRQNFTGKISHVTKISPAFQQSIRITPTSKGIVIREVAEKDSIGQQNRTSPINNVSGKGKDQMSFYTSFDFGSTSSCNYIPTLSPKEFPLLRSDFPLSRMCPVTHITQVTYLETECISIQTTPTAAINTTMDIEEDTRSKTRKRNRLDRGLPNVLNNIVDKPLTLPPARPCKYCGAKRFYHEPNGFCCSNGQVALISNTVPDKLYSMYTSDSLETCQFKTNIRTYNSNFAFTSFGVKYDKDLCKRNKGIYTFKIQGQVYHYINELLPSDNDPSYLQLYFYDTEHEIDNRMNRSIKLKSSIVEDLIDIFKSNPYATFFRSLGDITDWTNQNIVIKADPKLDQRVFNSPSSSQVAAIWFENDQLGERRELDIVVYSHSGYKHRVKYYFGCYDPLQYPLLFPYGETGWHQGIERVNKRGEKLCKGQSLVNPVGMKSPNEIITIEEKVLAKASKKERNVSCREYYCYRLQIRPGDKSILLRAGRLLQQYVVDMYVKIETSRLDYFRNNQAEIRSEVYQGIVDSITSGETRASKVGKRIVLPTSFIGGPRDMRKRYMDAMTLVQKFGKPDILLTMTCNPNWDEIKSELLFGDEAQNRPDLFARIFKAKLELMKEDLIKKEVLGPIAAWTYVIEYQKRGLPHAHFLLIFKKIAKLLTPESYDRIVSAEIPDKETHPHLYEMVVKHMMHGPCGVKNPQNVCMKRDGKCKNHYPKNFSAKTTQGHNSYPIYKRRDDGRQVKVRKQVLDNRWVVPYNPYLLAKYDCHINVEICSSIKAVKYLYKYIYKGHDQIAFNVVADNDIDIVDEIQRFQSARWISAVEGMWRIYRFTLFEMQPAVQSLQLHLEGKQLVTFRKYDKLDNIIKYQGSNSTMLTQFFQYNQTHTTGEKYLYKEFPEHFVWDQQSRIWRVRKKQNVIGRVISANPVEGERYFLRLLLNHIKGPTSYEHLRTFNNCIVSTFREAALLHGLLESDTNLEQCLEEAIQYQMPDTLRRLFATILVYCNPNNPKKLWDKFQEPMLEDYQKKVPNGSKKDALAKALRNINSKLETMGSTLRHYALSNDETIYANNDDFPKEIEDELNLVIDEKDLNAYTTLNTQQKLAYDIITKRVYSGKYGAFFVDGPGGTGKTYLYSALLATIRSKGHIALATATSGVAASILPGGRTAHSRFKIPIDIDQNITCNISKQTGLAKLIRAAKLIIWDEASMAKRQVIETFNDMMQDINDSALPFGGKVVVFGGDFRQVLPVVPKATREEAINASLVKSKLWHTLEKIRLTENMRAKLDPSFINFLLRVGDGTEQCMYEDKITLPPEMLIPFSNESIRLLALNVFPQLHKYAEDPRLMTYRAILTPTNDYVNDINNFLINSFPGKVTQYKSFDRTLDESQQGQHEDFLNSLTPKGLPPHILELKPNCPIILLRNIDPPEGLSNGTRLICRTLMPNLIFAEIAVGSHQGKMVFLPRIPLQPSDNEKYPVRFERKQFPVRLSFAMTINKAQGQTLENVGLYLPQPVFSHGQLYVALSRAKTSKAIKVMIKPTCEDESDYKCTKNVVFHEVLALSKT